MSVPCPFGAASYPRPGISFVALEDISPSQVAIAWRQDDDCQALQAFLAAVRTVAASIRDTAKPGEGVGFLVDEDR